MQESEGVFLIMHMHPLRSLNLRPSTGKPNQDFDSLYLLHNGEQPIPVTLEIFIHHVVSYKVGTNPVIKSSLWIVTSNVYMVHKGEGNFLHTNSHCICNFGVHSIV